MATIPGVSNNELVRTTWGNAVATELNGNVVKKTAAQTLAGPVTITSGTPSASTLTVAGLVTANGQVAITDTLPTAANHATRKDYVDDVRDDCVAIAGDTMTGGLSVGATPGPSTDGSRMRPDGAIISTVTTGATPTALPNLVLQRTGTQAAAAGGLYVRFDRAGTADQVGSITITAGPGVAYNETSDYRLKDELGPIDAPLDRILELQPKHLRWKADQTEFDGFIAHEVQAVVPYAVTGAKDAVRADGDIDPQQLDTGKLIALLVGAVQTLSARIDVLEGGGA
jgi:hypothetical protein